MLPKISIMTNLSRLVHLQCATRRALAGNIVFSKTAFFQTTNSTRSVQHFHVRNFATSPGSGKIPVKRISLLRADLSQIKEMTNVEKSNQSSQMEIPIRRTDPRVIQYYFITYDGLNVNSAGGRRILIESVLKIPVIEHFEHLKVYPGFDVSITKKTETEIKKLSGPLDYAIRCPYGIPRSTFCVVSLEKWAPKDEKMVEAHEGMAMECLTLSPDPKKFLLVRKPDCPVPQWDKPPMADLPKSLAGAAVAYKMHGKEDVRVWVISTDSESWNFYCIEKNVFSWRGGVRIRWPDVSFCEDLGKLYGWLYYICKDCVELEKQHYQDPDS